MMTAWTAQAPVNLLRLRTGGQSMSTSAPFDFTVVGAPSSDRPSFFTDLITSRSSTTAMRAIATPTAHRSTRRIPLGFGVDRATVRPFSLGARRAR
jgi:hypothetical protein